MNKSTVLTDDDVLDALPAFRRQTYHVREWWGSMVETLIFGEPPVEDAWQIIITDDADQAGVLGYHNFTPGGRPIAYVFAGVAKQYGLSWTITLSHELCEMIIDPWISAAFQTDNTTFYAAELCDPVESDDLGYTITAKDKEPVLVSDFVLPNWFIPGSPGQYDYKGHCTYPLEILEGGYAYVYDGGWFAEDHNGKRTTAEAFSKEHPDKTRLNLYNRDRDYFSVDR